MNFTVREFNSIYHESRKQRILVAKLRRVPEQPLQKQFLSICIFVKKITDNNSLLFFPNVLCWNSITESLKHHYPGQFPIIMLEMELNFRFSIPSPKWELNVTEQNVTQWDPILKYVTVTRCFLNNYHIAKPVKEMRYSASHKLEGFHIVLQHAGICQFIFWWAHPGLPLKKYRI